MIDGSGNEAIIGVDGRLVVDSDHYQDVATIRNEVSIDKIPAGEIFEKQLLEKKTSPSIKDIPTRILQVLKEHKHRKKLRRKMHYNMRLKFPMIGKSSSAFVFIGKDGKSKLHFLKEGHLARSESPHTPMREADQKSGRNQYKSLNLLSKQSLWSGHFVNITPEYENKSYTHMFLMDKHVGENASLKGIDIRVVNTLHKNGVLPITSDGFIINSR